MLIQNAHLKNRKTDAHADQACTELMRLLTLLMGCASVPDGYAQSVHKGRSIHTCKEAKFLIIFKVQ
jgi:hypothetical protein